MAGNHQSTAFRAVSALEAEIDKAAAKLWEITDDELKAIQGALAAAKRPGRGKAKDEVEE